MGNEKIFTDFILTYKKEYNNKTRFISKETIEFKIDNGETWRIYKIDIKEEVSGKVIVSAFYATSDVGNSRFDAVYLK